MAEQIKIGIIGLGFMGVTHLSIYKKLADAQVVAVADVDAEKRQGNFSSVAGNINSFEEEELFDPNTTRAYADGMELIADPKIELVDICVPVHLHKAYALAALHAGKHVLCEKPLTMSSEDAREIVSCAKQCGRMLLVGLCVRFWPEYDYVYRLHKSGALGQIHSAFFSRLSPTVKGNGWNNWFGNKAMSGGALLEMHMHDTDQVLRFFGRPRKVTSFGCRGIRSDDCWDHVCTAYDFGGNSAILAEGGWIAAPGTPFSMSFRLTGSLGSVVFDSSGLNIYYEDGRHEKPDLSGYNYSTGWEEEIAFMLKSLHAGNIDNTYITGQEIIDGLSIIEAERDSLEQDGKSIHVTYKD